jgi:FixJ family two-component response regulator
MEPASHDDSIVIVIDDDPDVREGIEALLQSVSLQSKAYPSATEFFRSKLSDQTSA